MIGLSVRVLDGQYSTPKQIILSSHVCAIVNSYSVQCSGINWCFLASLNISNVGFKAGILCTSCAFVYSWICLAIWTRWNLNVRGLSRLLLYDPLGWCFIIGMRFFSRCLNFFHTHVVYIFVVRWIRGISLTLLLICVDFFIDINNGGCLSRSYMRHVEGLVRMVGVSRKVDVLPQIVPDAAFSYGRFKSYGTVILYLASAVMNKPLLGPV